MLDTAVLPTNHPRIQSVARAVQLLEAVARSPEGLTASELSETVELKRSTAYHLLHTLASAGYVVADPRRRYRLGIGLGPLVEGYERQVIATDFLPLARALATETGETAYVATRMKASLALLCSVPGSYPVGVASSPVGPIQEGYARASGKLLLAYAPETMRDEYLATHPLAPLTEATITDHGKLLAELAEIRISGYATDQEEYSSGVCCVAAPLAGGSYALALSAPRERFQSHCDAYIEIAVRIAQQT